MSGYYREQLRLYNGTGLKPDTQYKNGAAFRYLSAENSCAELEALAKRFITDRMTSPFQYN